MKAYLTYRLGLCVLVLTAACSGQISGLAAVNAPSAVLQGGSGTNKNVVSVQVTDASNFVWVVQSSTDLTTWTEAGTMKVYNGFFRRQFTGTNAQGQFFRTVYDATRQTIQNTTTNALLLPGTPYNYSAPTLPASFSVAPITNQDNMPATNITTDAGANLGRVLFYDKRLSTNQSISCASCHQQSHGFSDPRQFSTGYDGTKGSRNAMGLSNARWYQRKHFFWDERANTLEDQVLGPIQNPVEMGMTLPALTTRLAAEPYYTNLFAQVFGSPGVTTNRISLALAQFVRSIVSTKSKYDVGAATGFTNFTVQEILGRDVFLGRVGRATCAACHGTDNFVPGPTLNNNGLEFPYVDTGVGGVTGLAGDQGLFKVPSLRNIELTAPYMHDGRFTNLEQVVEFYNSGVVDNPNLSPPLRNPPPGPPGPLRLNLTPDQKAALVAFLKTLTDTSLSTNKIFADPFNYGN